LPWWLAGFFLVVGLVLLKTGLWPRRRGRTLHCPTCNHNLTGLAGERCPECGEPVTPSTAVFEARATRPVRIATGVVLLCLSGGLAAAAKSHVDWYPVAPTALLISQIRSGDVPTAGAAWGEVGRRITAGKLSASQHATLIDVALAEQGATTGRAWQQDMIDYLGSCYFKGLMSQAQQTRFFDQMTIMDLKIRPKIVRGDSVPYLIKYRFRMPSKGMWHRVGAGKDVFLDGQLLPDGANGYTGGSERQGGSMGLLLECKTPGKHKLTVIPEVILYSGSNFDPKTSTALSRRQVPLNVPFEVLTSEPPDYVRFIKDPSLAPGLRASITPTELRLGKPSDTRKGRRYELEGRMEIVAPPVDIAFDVVARIDGRTYRMGSVHLLRGESTNSYLGCEEVVRPKPDAKADIIFRSNRKVIRETVDQFSLWEGELIYKDLPVEMAPSTGPGG
jgi:hypothetical protein